MGSAVYHQYDRKAPSFCSDVLAKFGTNPYGQPLFRVSWSESVLEQVGGTWEDRAKEDEVNRIAIAGSFVHDTNPVVAKTAAFRWVPRYPFPEPRWVLEKWLPTSVSPDYWYNTPQLLDFESGLPLLGPYLEHGDYHLCYKLEDRGKFMPVTASVVEYYARLIEAGKEYSDVQKRLAIEERLKRAKRDYDNRFDAVWDDAQLAGGTENLFMSMRGGKSKDRVKPEDVKFGNVDDIPLNLPRKSGFSQLF